MYGFSATKTSHNENLSLLMYYNIQRGQCLTLRSIFVHSFLPPQRAGRVQGSALGCCWVMVASYSVSKHRLESVSGLAFLFFI